MNAFQISAVCVCIFLNSLDGFDVLAISFASPGIAADWNTTRAELGVVLSMELIGMAVGSILLGGVADRFGRRPTILACLITMAAGMYLASTASSIAFLLLVRFVTGLGIGGMLASVNAMVAEYANRRSRNLCVMLMAAGYPIGVIAGGSVASVLLIDFDWRAVFVLGACMTGLAIIVVWFLLPESVEYLVEKRPRNALVKINRTLQRMGHPVIDQLPDPIGVKQGGSYRQLFSNKFLSITIILTAAYFFHIMSFYYIVKWIPKIVVDMQYAASTAGGVLVAANVGGALGAVIIGLLATKLDLRRLVVGVMLLSFVAISVFGLQQQTLVGLSLASAGAGFFTNAGIVGLYALFVRHFPAAVRATGTGFIIGVGRGGAALGPIVAGLLFTGGFALFSVSVLMACGALLAAIALIILERVRPTATEALVESRRTVG